MKLSEFIKSKLEEKYLGKSIKNWNGEKSFIVGEISVTDGGVDPQTEISLRSEFGSKCIKEWVEWQNTHNPIGGNLPSSELENKWKVGYLESWYMTSVDDEMPELVE